MNFLFTTCIKYEGSHQVVRLEQTNRRRVQIMRAFYTSSTLFLALTSPTGGGRSVGIVRSWTKATEFYFIPRYISCEPNSHIHLQCISFNYIYQTSQII